MSLNFKKNSWLLWCDASHSPYLNMAIDELLLEESFNAKIPILRFYGWDRPSLSIGYIQKFNELTHQGYTVVRRPTGGGVVYHDIDMTYTVVIPQNHKLASTNRLESYKIFHDLIIEALKMINIKAEFVETTNEPKERSTMKCFSAPVRFDITATEKDPNGKISKIAGAAQRRTKFGILHQGSIVIENIDKYQKELQDGMIKIFENKMNIAFTNFMPSSQFLINAEQLSSEKYSTEKWNAMR